MGYRKSSLGAGVPSEKVYMLHHHNKRSSKPFCLQCVVSKRINSTAESLDNPLIEKLQLTFLIEVFLLKCQYYSRLAPRGSGKP